MPSGITHILLTKELQNRFDVTKSKEDDLKSLLAAGLYFFQLGAVGPDLPYASIAGNRCVFSAKSDLADKFHYIRTNELPHLAFDELRNKKKDPVDMELIYAFSFFLGYLSHVFADGIIHPFVRDKVGDYAENSTAHRVLEMRIDVLFYYYLTEKSGAGMNLNYSNIQDELENINSLGETQKVMSLFKEVIKKTYNVNTSAELILDWAKGLYRLFSVAAGEHPAIYKGLKMLDGVTYRNYDDLKRDREKIFLLTKPVDRDKNFINAGSVHFISDCTEHFYKKFKPVALKAYDYVFNDGPELSVDDIPPIDLDTGRSLAGPNDLDKKPVLWS